MPNDKSKIKIWFVAAVFLFSLLQTAVVENTTGIANRIVSLPDDILTCVCLVYLLVSLVAGKINLKKAEWIIVAAFSAFILITFVSSAVYKYQPISTVITDFLSCTRFIAIYFAVRVFLPLKDDNEKILQIIVVSCRLLITIMSVFAIHDVLFEPIFAKDLGAIDLFFSSHTEMAACCFSCCSVFVLNGEISRGKRKYDFLFVLLSILCACLTLRTKAYGASIMVIVLYCFFAAFEIKPICKILALFAGFLGTVFVAYNKIVSYYMSDIPTARNIMFKDSIKLATQHFPLGTGFGTFGSSAAFKNTSPLYLKLNYPDFLDPWADRWDAFVCDGFWQVVIAQSGWLGLASFLVVLAGFLFLSIKMYRKNRYASCAMMITLAYLGISTFGETAFFHPMLSNMFITFAISENIFDGLPDN